MVSLPSSVSSASPRTLITASVVLSSTLTALSIVSFQALRRKSLRESLRRDVALSLTKDDLRIQHDGYPEPDGRDAQLLADGGIMQVDGREVGSDAAGQAGGKKKKFSEELVREQLARNYVFLGEEGMALVRKSYVVVVGCGGVGSWAALMLLRSGVSHLLLIDFDLTTLSSLNRHACATLADVGTPKVIATKKYLEKVAPWATIDVKVGLWRAGPEGEALLQGADWVVDAIDNLTTKAQLLTHCHKNSLKVFSSMGAGAKCDPTRVQIADLSLTQEDPLARSVRRLCRMEGVVSGIPVVFSTEVPTDVRLLPLPEEEFKKGNVKELGAFDDFRVRILPVLGPLPAIFGLNIATYILQDIAGKPILQPMETKNRKKLYSKLHNDLVQREGKYLQIPEGHRIVLDQQDVSMIYEELHQGGRSILPYPSPTASKPKPKAPKASDAPVLTHPATIAAAKAEGLDVVTSESPSEDKVVKEAFYPFSAHPICLRPALVRWDLSKELSVTNCVVMEQKDAERHLQLCGIEGKRREEVWGLEVEKGVGELMALAERILSWREKEA